MSDGVSAEQPLSPGGLGAAHTHQQLPQLPVLCRFKNVGGEQGTETLGYLSKPQIFPSLEVHIQSTALALPFNNLPLPAMAVRRDRSWNLHLPFPPSSFPTLQPHVDVCGEGLGWLLSISPGHLLQPVLPSQKSSGGKNKTEKFWVCILAGVRGTKKEPWSGVSCKYSR